MLQFRALASCARLGGPGKVLPFWPSCCVVGVPIMKEQQATSSVDELHEVEQPQEGVATFVFLFAVSLRVP